MLDHLSIGVSDLARTRAFYDGALTPLGYACLYSDNSALGYGDKSAIFWTLLAKRPIADDPDSGLHFCFMAPSRASVEAFYAAALALGGRDNGKPGLREAYGPDYYAAFVHDPDGYRLEAYTKAK